MFTGVKARGEGAKILAYNGKTAQKMVTYLQLRRIIRKYVNSFLGRILTGKLWGIIRISSHLDIIYIGLIPS